MVLGLPLWGVGVVGVASVCVALYLVSVLTAPRKMSVKGKTVVITGGSEGIGLAAARRIVQRGGKVALLSRRQGPLDAAKATLAADVPSGSALDDCVLVVSTDVTDTAACDRAMKLTADQFGGIHMIINCAGMSIPRAFEDSTVEQWNQQWNVNVIGTRNATHAALPYIKRNPMGRVVFTSSMAGQASFYGFSSYSATKFALVGFAQALQSELEPLNIRVSVLYPPDTETPGLARENEHKPELTKKLSESGGFFTAEQVAARLVSGVEAGSFAVSVGLDGWALATLNAGFGPGTLWEIATQVATMGILRIVAAVICFSNSSTVAAYVKKHGAANKAKAE